MGAFDDLLPPPTKGAFDDLVPQNGRFDDLVPAATPASNPASKAALDEISGLPVDTSKPPVDAKFFHRLASDIDTTSTFNPKIPYLPTHAEDALDLAQPILSAGTNLIRPSAIARSAVDLGNFLQSPQGIGMLGISLLPPGVQKLVTGTFAATAVKNAPETLMEMARAKTPEEQRAAQTSFINNALMGVGGAAHALSGEAAAGRPAGASQLSIDTAIKEGDLMRSASANTAPEVLDPIVQARDILKAQLEKEPNENLQKTHDAISNQLANVPESAITESRARIAQQAQSTPPEAPPAGDIAPAPSEQGGRAAAFTQALGEIAPETTKAAAEIPDETPPPTEPPPVEPSVAAPDKSGEQLPPGTPGETPPVGSEGPGAAASTEPLGQPQTTALKRAVVDLQRAAEGRPEIPVPERASSKELISQAEDAMTKDPTEGQRVVDRINSAEVSGQQVSPQDAATLLVERTRLRNERTAWEERAADEGTTEAERAAARDTAQELENKIDNIDQASRKAGTAWSDFGRLYQQVLRDDFTVEALERKTRAAKGGPLNEGERAKIKEQADQIEKLTKEKDAAQQAHADAAEKAASAHTYEQALKSAQAELANRPKISGHIMEIAKKIVTRLNENADAARIRLRERLKNLSAGVDPGIVLDVAEIMASHIGEIGLDLAESSARVLSEFGDKVKPFLQDAWKKAQELVNGSTKDVKVKDAVKTGAAKKTRSKADIQGTLKAEAVAKDPLSHQTVFDIAHEHIKAGLRGDEVMDATLKDVQEAYPEATLRDVHRAYGEYGKVKFPSKDAIKMHEAELRRIVQLKESIDRLKEGESPLHTGLQRSKATQAIREKTKELNELLKKHAGPPSPEKLASRDQAKQTALRNRIEDLDKQLRTGEKPAKGEPMADSTQTEQLRAERDAMAAKLKEIEESAKPKPTPEDIAHDKAQEAVDRAAAALDRQQRINSGEIKPEAKEKVQPLSELERELRDRTAELKEAKKKSDAYKSPEDIAAEQAQKGVDSATAALDRWDRILKGEIQPEGKTPAEAKSALEEEMRSQVEAMKAAHRELKAAERPKTDPESAREQAQLKALEKSIAEYERRAKEVDLEPKGRRHGPDTAQIAKAKAARDAAKKVVEDMREARKTVKTPEERYNETRMKAVQKQLDEAQRRLRAGDFSPKPKPIPKEKTDAVKRKELELATAKRSVNEGMEKQRLANRPTYQKVLDQISGAARASALSGYHTLGKLLGYSLSKFAETPLTEATGAGLSKVPGLRGIFEKANLESGSTLGALAKLYTKAATTGLKEAATILRTGKSSAKTLHDTKDFKPVRWYDFFGALHSAEKEPLRLGTQEMLLHRLTENAIKQGLDVNDEFVRAAINKEAYDYSQRSILQENNMAAEAVNGLHARLEKVNPSTGQPEITKLVISTLLRTLLTKGIIRTPANYIAQTIARTPIGLLTGIGKTVAAHARGLDNLKPAEANTTARLLKAGLVGSAFFTLGAIDATRRKEDRVFGGYYEPGEKRDGKDAAWGKLRIGGVTIPHLLTHNPLLESAQMGNTMVRVARQKYGKTGDEKGMLEGALKSIIALGSKAPIANPLMRASEGRSNLAADIVKGLVPQLIQNIAQDTDPKDRSPKTTTDQIKSTIPVLREQTPVRKK